MVKSKSESVNSRKNGIKNEKQSSPVVKIVNPFDRKINKNKHTVLNKPTKGTSSDIGQSRYNAIEKRKKTLLVEMNQLGKNNQFIDSRYGENNASMSEEDKMLARFQKEKMRNKNLYNLEDNDGVDNQLTHMGQALGNSLGDGTLGNDDYVASDDELDDVGKELLSERQRFGGGDDDNNGNGKERYKSKKEIYQEIIEKSKAGKAERAREKLKKEDLTRELDEEFNLIRGDLILTHDQNNRSSSSSSNEDDAFLKFQKESRDKETQFATGTNTSKSNTNGVAETDDFDSLLVELQGESRARATDRTKTKEEEMKEQMEILQQKEKERLERASGDYVELEKDVDEKDKNLPRKVKDRLKSKDNKPKMLTADSLDDENEVLNINGVDTVFYNPAIDSDDENKDDEDEDDEDEDEDEDNSDSLETDDEDKSDEDGEEEEDSDQDLEDDEILSGQEEEEEEEEEETTSKKSKTKKVEQVVETIPYTFETPKSIDELDEWLLNRTSEEKETILERIKVCNHVSIKPQNKDKMKEYLPILYQRFINCSKASTDGSPVDWKELDLLSKNIFEISQDVPIVSGITAKDLVNSCYKRICKKLEIQSKLNYWPNQQELLVLKLNGNVFPTSDFQHPVVTPTVEALNFFLSHCPIKNINDIVSSLFTSNILFFYLSSTKRYSPEISSLLISLLSTFINHNPPQQTTNSTTATTKSTKNSKSKTTTTTTPTTNNNTSQWASISTNILIPTIVLPQDYLKLSSTPSNIKKIEPSLLDFSILSNQSLEINDELRINLLNYLISFLSKYIKFYSESQFNESLPSLFTNILGLLNKLTGSINSNVLNLKLVESIKSLKELIESINNEIIASRRPLILLTSKPKTLRQFNPRFAQDFSFFNKDPDAERNHNKKMKALIKKETKGALREIVKDNQFIHAEKFKKAVAERKENDLKRKQIMTELQQEQQEHKQYKKMKDRLDGRI